MHFHNLFFPLAALYDICDTWLFNTKWCDLHKLQSHSPLTEDKIEVKDKDLFSYLYSDQFTSDLLFVGFYCMCVKEISYVYIK